MAVRKIFRNTIAQYIVGSKNPIIKRFRNLKDAIAGTCLAPILILIAIGILFYSEGFRRTSKLLAELPLENASEVSTDFGNHKIQGIPIITNKLKAPKIGEVLYYSSVTEIYEEVEETERETVTKVIDGQEVEEVIETVKLVEKWQNESTTSGKWASFNLSGIAIAPVGADLELNYKIAEYWDDGYGNFYEVDSSTLLTPHIGDRKMVITYLDVDEELIVAGEIADNKIANTDELFVISNKSNTVLLADLESGENILYFVMKFMSWLLLTIGFGSILAPVIAIVDFIPFAGGIAKTIGFFTSAITAFIIVVIASILIKFWWLFLIFTVLTIGGLIALLIMYTGKSKESK